jgi:hypothetical protein
LCYVDLNFREGLYLKEPRTCKKKKIAIYILTINNYYHFQLLFVQISLRQMKRKTMIESGLFLCFNVVFGILNWKQVWYTLLSVALWRLIESYIHWRWHWMLNKCVWLDSLIVVLSCWMKSKWKMCQWSKFYSKFY